MIESILREIGLTEYETKIYLALLDLGKATSGEILNKAGLRTGKVYEILNSLKTKGLVSEIKESNVKKFLASDPKRVYDYLEEKKKTIEKQEKDFEKIIPELMKKINSTKSEVNVEVFYGVNGMKTAYMKEFEHDKKGGTVYVMGVRGEEFYSKGYYDFFINNIYPRRIKSGVNIKKIYSEDARKYRDMYEKEADMRFIPYESPVTILVTGTLTIIGIQSKEINITITIESKEVADSFIQQFNILWKQAKL
jgi:sugar-specific transcriptional regulator TrmB